MLRHPSAPLSGYQVIEVTIPGDSPEAGRKLGDLPWPPAATLVSVLRGRRLRPPESEITLSAGDRVSLPVPVLPDAHHSHQDDRRDHVAGREAGDRSSA